MIEGRDIAEGVARCGIGPGDTLMLHADAMVAAQLPPLPKEARLDLVIEAILGVLGPTGTLVMPAFGYSFTRGEDFDRSAPVPEMGLLAERFRQRPGTRRSLNPIFSVTASGAAAEEFARSSVADCFGPGTAFDLLARRNAWLACLACPFSLTFTHWVEQRVGVDYRSFKPFRGRIEGGPEIACRYYVRDLARDTHIDLGRLRRRMAAAGTLRAAPIGRVELLAVRAADFEAAARALLAEDPAGLIREGAGRA